MNFGAQPDWRVIGIKLAAHAAFRARQYKWRTGRSDLLPAGKTAEDIAAEAILKVLQGTRTVLSSSDPLPSLKRIVDSIVNHLANSLENKLQIFMDDSSDGAQADRLEHESRDRDLYNISPSAFPHPSQPCDAHSERLSQERISKLRNTAASAGHAALVDVLDAMTNHKHFTPSSIARFLGVSREAVYNRLRRLREIYRLSTDADVEA